MKRVSTSTLLLFTVVILAMGAIFKQDKAQTLAQFIEATATHEEPELELLIPELLTPLEFRPTSSNEPVYMLLQDIVDTSAIQFITPSKAADIDWKRLVKLSGWPGGEDLLKVFYSQGSLQRNASGYPDSNGTVTAWNKAAALAASQQAVPQETLIFSEIETRYPANAEEAAAGRTISVEGELCRRGLQALAADPKIQEMWPGITPEGIKTSDNCAVGAIPVPAKFFAPGEPLGTLGNKNVWQNKEAVAEAFLILTTTGHIPESEVSSKLAKEIEAAWILIEQENAQRSAAKSNGKVTGKGYAAPEVLEEGIVLTAPNNVYVLLHYGNYGNAAAFQSMGLANRHHNGTDLSVSGCTQYAAHAMAPGKVISTRWDANNGGVLVQSIQGHPNAQLIYVHMQKDSLVKDGTKLERGTYIGDLAPADPAERGILAAGCIHLHVMLVIDGVPVNPEPYIIDLNKKKK